MLNWSGNQNLICESRGSLWKEGIPGLRHTCFMATMLINYVTVLSAFMLLVVPLTQKSWIKLRNVIYLLLSFSCNAVNTWAVLEKTGNTNAILIQLSLFCISLLPYFFLPIIHGDHFCSKSKMVIGMLAFWGCWYERCNSDTPFHLLLTYRLIPIQRTHPV